MPNPIQTNSAQGTIEYLVIIAVVVVLALIVVGLLISTTGNSTQTVTDSSSQLSNTFSGAFSVSDVIIDPNGDALIKVKNLSGDNMTLTKIIIGNEESAYDDLISNGGEKAFGLADSNTNCLCQPNQKNATCNIEIHYTSSSGMEKKETRSMTIECTTDTQSTNPVLVSGLGSGTLLDPFVINSCKELQRMNQRVDGNYVLGGDINCAETITWNNGAGFQPIEGTRTIALDGRGHEINNLYINRILDSDLGVGLFGEVTLITESSHYIKNLSLLDFNIAGYGYVGGLIGKSNYSGTDFLFSDITIRGNILGGYYTGYGGAIGGVYHPYAGSTFDNIDLDANVLAADQDGVGVGGFIGTFECYGCHPTNISYRGRLSGYGSVGYIYGFYNSMDWSGIIQLESVTADIIDFDCTTTECNTDCSNGTYNTCGWGYSNST